jgi:hypothetical protein
MKNILVACALLFASPALAEDQSETPEVVEASNANTHGNYVGYVPLISPMGAGVRWFDGRNSSQRFVGVSAGVSPLIGLAQNNPLPARLRAEAGALFYLSGTPGKGFFVGATANANAWLGLFDEPIIPVFNAGPVLGGGALFKESGWSVLTEAGIMNKVTVVYGEAVWLPLPQFVITIIPPRK